MKKRLFLAAALYHKRANDNKGMIDVESSIIFSGKEYLATDEKIVAMLVVRELPEEFTSKLEDVEILVRPF